MAEGQCSRRRAARCRPLAEIAAQKAIASKNPRELPPGKYTVILEPAAVLDAVGFMFWDFGGSALLEQRSFLNDRIGTQLFGENITVWDDVYHPLQTGVPFDGEGMKRHRLKLIDNGVVQQRHLSLALERKARCSSRRWPAKSDRSGRQDMALRCPTKSARRRSISCSTAAEPGQSQTVEQMVASTERGILVTRLWYIREVDPYEKILTGMTRDGTFLVEDGKIAGRRSQFPLQ